MRMAQHNAKLSLTLTWKAMRLVSVGYKTLPPKLWEGAEHASLIRGTLMPEEVTLSNKKNTSKQ